MPKNNLKFHKIQKKIGIYFSFTITLVLLLTILIYFVFVSKNIRQTTRNHLLDIISISVINIDAEIHKTLTKPEQENNKAYLQIKKDLQLIRDAATDVHFIYTMRFNEQSGITFVVDAEENPEDIAHLGEKYTEASQFLKDNIRSLQKPIVEENFYTDRWGMWLTGYAPFYDSKGNIEGILGIDIEAKIVKSYERKVLFLAIFILVIIIPIVYFIGFRIGKKIARPIEILTKGALAIADGNLDLEIPQTTNDEIGLLAESFNKMSKQLRDFFENKEKIISERTKEIKAGEKNLSSLFNAMTDLVMELDYDGRYITIAPTSPNLMFKPSQEIIQKTLHEVFPKSEADMFLNFIQKCLDEGKTNIMQYSLIIKNKTVWFESRVTPKTKNTVLFIARDITKQKKQQKELINERDTLARFKKVTISRELNLIKLKTEINELLEKLGKKPKYLVAKTKDN